MVTRILTAAVAGIAVTLSLLYVMNMLVQLRAAEPAPTVRTPLWLARVRVVETPPRVEATPPDFRELTKPLHPVPTARAASPAVEPVRLAPSGPATPRLPAGGVVPEPDAADAPLIGVLMVQPAYPVIALERELEGFVVVEFDVRADGSVENVAVVESSHGLFEKSAMAAAQRCRFKPRTVAGMPRPSYGIRKRFVFEMKRG